MREGEEEKALKLWKWSLGSGTQKDYVLIEIAWRWGGFLLAQPFLESRQPATLRHTCTRKVKSIGVNCKRSLGNMHLNKITCTL